MSTINTCNKCGSTNLEVGDLIDGFDRGPLLFRPASKRFFTLRSGADVTAFVCMECGSVQMSVDVNAVAGMLKQEKPSSDDEESSGEPVECLECGATIEAGESKCPKCGWTYTS